MKNILITGATSFVGINLIKHLYNDNQIIAVIRPNSKGKSKLDQFPKAKIIECDMGDISSLKSSLKTPIDIAYLLAWRGVRGEDRFNQEIQESNYLDTILTYKALLALGTRTIMTIGSQAEFGNISKPANINTEPHPTNAYGFFKLKVFNDLSQLSLTDNVNYKHGRIFSSYGPGDSANTIIAYLISQFLTNKPVDVTKCSQLWEFIFIDDCVDAIAKIGEFGKNRHPYSIGTGDIHELKYFVEQIRSFFANTQVNYNAIPYSNNQPMYLGANISDLSKDTGFKPIISFEHGISKMISYFLGTLKYTDGNLKDKYKFVN